MGALTGGPSEPATFSLDTWWSNPTSSVKIDTGNNFGHDFGGKFVFNEAHMRWSAQNPTSGFSFTSNPASTSVSLVSKLGSERNGIFFP